MRLSDGQDLDYASGRLECCRCIRASAWQRASLVRVAGAPGVHRDTYTVARRTVIKILSIAFHNMDQVEFGQWYDKMLAFILERALPNTSQPD